ncbi:MAG: lipocalin family protein [Bacteroidota bacterium]
MFELCLSYSNLDELLINMNLKDMKFSKLFFILLAVTIFSACSDDEDAPNISEDLLVGDWELTDLDYSGTSVLTVPGLGEGITSTFEGTGLNLNLDLTFTTDPNEFITQGDYGVRLVTTIEGQEVVNELENADFINNGTWTRDGNILTVTSTLGGPQEATIISVDQNSFTLGYDFEETVTELGVTNTTVVNGVYIFSRK